MLETCGRAARTRAKMKSRARQEASAQEARGYCKQFAEAKHLGVQILGWQRSFWFHRHEEVQAEKLCDWTMRVHHQDGQTRLLPQGQGQMGIERFPRQNERTLTDWFHASTRHGFRRSCHMAASQGCNLFHIDLKTAFLQGQSHYVNRGVVCQLPPEAGHAPFIAARLKKPAYGMNDAARRSWTVLDKALCSYGMVPTRADRCCYVLYSTQSRERTWKQFNSTWCHDTSNISIKPRVTTETDDAFEKMLNPIAGRPATGKSVARIINLFVDDLFGTSGTEMKERVPSRLGKVFQGGSEDWSHVTFTGQRIRWTEDSQSGRCIEVSQQKAIDELEGIAVERNTEKNIYCTPAMHTRNGSLLGQINWFQSWTQFQCWYKFSICASKAVSTTVGDVKDLDKLTRA